MSKQKITIASVLLGANLTALMGLYMWQVERITQESYFSARQQNQVIALKSEIKTLEQEYTSNFTLSNVEKVLAQTSFSDVKTIKYLTVNPEYLVRQEK